MNAGERRRAIPKRVLAAALVALTSVAVATSSPAGAACAVVEDETSPVVFVGVAHDVRPDEDRSTSAAVAEFRVEQWIRGGPGDTVEVLTNASSTSDGQFISIADERALVNPGDRWEIHGRARPSGRIDTACQASTVLATGLPMAFEWPPWTVLAPAGVLVLASMAIAWVLAAARRRSTRPARPVDA